MDKDRVLIVEDDPDLLRAYTRALQSEGHEILQASTGAEARRVCREQRPDLLLLDVMLGDENGIEICKEIKTDPELDGTFVVMLSGLRVSAENQAEALRAGADGYLTKPIEAQALRAHVLAFLRIKRNERDLRESERRYRQQAQELLEANRRLEEYNRLKAEFVANMSHELRTPLTAIIGFAQLVQMKQHGAAPLPSFYSDALERIQRNGQHLLALINDVLDVSKIEAGRMKIHGEHIDLAEVMQDAFSELQSLAQRKKLAYRLSMPERLPLAYTDPLRVRQIIINLLSNAIKFTARGAVEAQLLPDGPDRFRLVVSDTGVGIEEKSLGIIFERFRQADGSATRAAGGAGLGLSIVRQIVDLLGGEIEVKSDLSVGTSFTVTLPMSVPTESVEGEAGESSSTGNGAGLAPVDDAALQRARAAAAEEGAAPLVLVVEDDEDAAALLSATIERAGYRSFVAANGAHALKLARELAPVAVTLDVMMPGMDGWRVLREMRSDRRMAHIPVIVCSIVDNRPLGYSLGASDYLLKPVEPEKLMDALDKIIVTGPETDDYVLVIDDEHGVRELLVAALKQAGFNVRSAANGEAGLKIIEQSQPRAVLCDLMMPNGMSGFEFIARVRSEPRTANLPIIIVTGKDLTQDDRRFLSGQIENVIRKGELMMSEVGSRLRETLEHVGVKPTNGEDSVD
jgi:DNA-binding response OmpR family regulator